MEKKYWKKVRASSSDVKNNNKIVSASSAIDFFMTIDSYTFGRIVVDGKSYDSDVILYKGTVYPNWRRMSEHFFQIDDIEKHLKKNPKILLIDTGFSKMM